MFRHPKGGKGTSKNLFLIPLENDVWYSLIFFSLGGLMIFYLIHRFELSRRVPEIDQSAFSTSAINIVSFLSVQDVSTSFVSLHAKIIIFFMFVMTFIVWQFYNAAIIGALLVPPPKYIKDVKGLLDSNLKIILEDVASSVGSFKVTNNEYGRQLYNEKVKGRERILSVLDGVSLVKQGDYAFYTYVDWAYDFVKKSFTADEIDDLVEISFYPKAVHSNMYYPIEKYSPYKEMFRLGAQILVETGVAAHMTTRWTSEKPVGNLDDNEVVVVDFAHTSTLIYLLLFGYLLSLVALGLEIGYQRIKKVL